MKMEGPSAVIFSPNQPRLGPLMKMDAEGRIVHVHREGAHLYLVVRVYSQSWRIDELLTATSAYFEEVEVEAKADHIDIALICFSKTPGEIVQHIVDYLRSCSLEKLWVAHYDGIGRSCIVREVHAM